MSHCVCLTPGTHWKAQLIRKRTGSDNSTWWRNTCSVEAVPASAQESSLWNAKGWVGEQNSRTVHRMQLHIDRSPTGLHKYWVCRFLKGDSKQKIKFFCNTKIALLNGQFSIAWGCPLQLQLLNFFKNYSNSWALKLWKQWKFPNQLLNCTIFTLAHVLIIMEILLFF